MKNINTLTKTRILTRLFFIVIVLVSLLSSIYIDKINNSSVHAATSSNLNFQARLYDDNGRTVPDGYYNIQFKLYDALSGGTNLWTEQWYDSNGVTAGNDNRVRVVNGYMSVQLATHTPFPAINWDQDMWISLNVGGSTQTATPTYDGEMNPRLKLTAVPYAFQAKQAEKLVLLQGANTGTLNFTTLTANRNILLPNEDGTICLQSATTCGFAASTGSTAYIQNNTSLQTNANFNIQALNSGINGTIGGIIRGAAGGQTVDLLQLQSSGGAVLSKFTASGALDLTGLPVNSNALLLPGGNITFAGGVRIWNPNADATLRFDAAVGGSMIANAQASLQVNTVQGGINLTNSGNNGLAPTGFVVNFTGGDITHSAAAGLRVQNNSGITTFNVNPHGSTTITNYAATDTSLVLKGAASQVADLQQWQNSIGTVLSRIDANGNIGQSNGTALYNATAGLTAGTARIDESTTNLVPNPSFEPNTTGWIIGGSTTRVTTDSLAGGASLKIDTGGSPLTNNTYLSAASVSTSALNDRYTHSVYIKGSGSGGGIRVRINDCASTGYGDFYVSYTSFSSSEWKRFSVTTPALAAGVSICAQLTPDAFTGVVYVDAVQIEKKAYATSYTDGSLGSGYAWTGTAHGSTSTRINGGFVGDSITAIQNANVGNTLQVASQIGIGLAPTIGSGLLQLASGTTAANGITFGADTNLYRSAADTLKTDDAFVIGGTSGTDSPNKLQVQNTAGVAVLNVDSTNSITSLRGVNSTATFGSELATGAVCTGTNWAGGGPWTHTAGSVADLSCTPPASVTSGATYRVVFTITGRTTGSVLPKVGGSFGSSVAINSTNQTQVMEAFGTTNLVFTPSTDFDGTISNISLQLVTTSNAVLKVIDDSDYAALEFRGYGDNLFIGNASGQSLTSGFENSGFGSYTLQNNTTGNFNAANGVFSLHSNTTGSENTASGAEALSDNTSGSSNTASGYFSLGNNSTGSRNSTLGAYTLTGNTSGGRNVAVGYNAGNTSVSANRNVTGSFNTFLGYDSGPGSTTQLQNATAIGTYAVVSQNDSLVLGCINGINGCTASTKVGIGIDAPTELLHIKSTADAGLILHADSDDTNEDDNAFINFIQDGAGNSSVIGTVGNANFSPMNNAYTGTFANSTLLGTVGNNALHLGTNSNVRLTVNNAGDVGIGTGGSIDARLDIVNTGTAPHTTTGFELQSTFSPTAGGTQNNARIVTTNSATTVANTTRGLEITVVNSGTLASTNIGLYVDVATANANDTQYAAILLNGNVGIGVPTPSAKLHVSSDSAPILFKVTDETATAQDVLSIADGGAATFRNQTDSVAAFQIQNATGASLFTADTTNNDLKVTANIVAQGSATANTGTTSGTGTNTTTLTLTGSVAGFANEDVIFIDNAGQDYYTRITAGAGTATLTVSPAITFETARTVTEYNVQNIGSATNGTPASNNDRFFQGYFLGGIVAGAGSTHYADGSILFQGDTNLYRSAANTLKTNDNFSIQTTSDATAALQAQRNNGDVVFRVDTSNNRFVIGNATGPAGADATLFVVDSAPTGNLPAVVNGGIIYDSTLGQFKIAEGGTYKILCNKTDLGCGAGGGANDLQAAYNASGTPATILTTAPAKTIIFRAGGGYNSTSLFEVQDDGGLSILTVDTVNRRVAVGLDSADDPAAAFQVQGNTAGGQVGSIIQNRTTTNGSTASLLFRTTTSNVSNFASITQARVDSDNASLGFSTRQSGVLTESFSLGANGSALFKNGTNSATAFQIQNSSGASLLTANTLTNTLTVMDLLPQTIGSNESNPSIVVDGTGDVGQYTATAIAPDGFARIAYFDVTNADLKYVQCTNDTCSTKNIASVDSVAFNTSGRYASIAIAPDGFARISYHDQSNDWLKFIQCTNAACTTRNTSVVDSFAVGGHTSIAIAPDGFARISYYDSTNSDLKYAQCTNASCNTNNKIVVDGSVSNVGQYSSIAIAPDGFARISYYDNVSLDLKYAQCTNITCSGKNITTVDASVNSGQYSSIAIAPDGFARISYYDLTDGDLMYAQCTSADCTAKNINIIDSTGNVGQYTSIAIGSDDFARIAYYDVTNADLKYAQCTNDTCVDKNISIVDETANKGQHTSIAIAPADGFARLSYYDVTNGDLKFAQCLNDGCGGMQGTNIGTLLTPFASIYGVAINATGADYAEWIPWEGAKPGVGSVISHKGSSYVVSSPATAAFIGNTAIDTKKAILVTFAGQVPVRVTGPVSEGDLLVPNGDGTAIAISPSEAKVTDHLRKVAIAQEANSEAGIKNILGSVGTTSSELSSSLQGDNQEGVFASLNVSGATTLNTLIVAGDAIFKGNIIVEGHIVTTGNTPTSEALEAIGANAEIVIEGNDTLGTITIKTGSDPNGDGALIKLLFDQAFGKAPKVLVSPANESAADMFFYRGETTNTGFQINAKGELLPDTEYKLDYFIAE